ncbi:MAG: sugar transferase [Clostridia bacterium]|nr:sugar transferase [Clostridia bacterium]
MEARQWKRPDEAKTRGKNQSSSRPERNTYIDREQILKRDKNYWIGRRTQDIILSLLALLIIWPVMLIVSLAIWLDSPGASPIFTQVRVGRNGKTFKFRKFRSMIPDAETKLEGLIDQNEMDGPVFKIKNDPRITRIGRFIRKTSIDEIPQLFNVLMGDMSIVGPRPALPREVEQYDDYEKQRLYVTPGLTCYWQIQPKRNDMSFDEWLELDLKYIRDRSFRVDWIIILKTVGAVLGMNGV